MKAHDYKGNEFDITREEVERLANELAKHDGKESNKSFMNRAAENIHAVTGEYPHTEDELKEILYKNTSGTTQKQIELIFESMEWIAGMHSEKTKSM